MPNQGKTSAKIIDSAAYNYIIFIMQSLLLENDFTFWTYLYEIFDCISLIYWGRFSKSGEVEFVEDTISLRSSYTKNSAKKTLHSKVFT